MDAAKYFIRGVTLLATDPGLQEALSRVYESSERPRCMCVRGGVEMYIAKHGEYVVKRMPGTGDMHHPTCQSFEPEPGLSGLGELVGEAIVEHNADHVEIRTAHRIFKRPLETSTREPRPARPAWPAWLRQLNHCSGAIRPASTFRLRLLRP